MSELEATANRLLGPRLTELDPGIDFDRAQSEDLARWVVLKSMVLARASQGNVTLPFQIYDDFRRGKMPADVFVEVFLTPTSTLNSFIGPIALRKAIDIPREEVDEFGNRCWIVGLQVGRIVFRTSFVPQHPKIRRSAVKFRAKVLYP
ncbi:MAG TPA: hypothetical protein VFJ90_08695, partial [Candidatus Didemnitutus sp.]|nr:hypothetical protein [Candidatus Didemnitutus sp.]